MKMIVEANKDKSDEEKTFSIKGVGTTERAIKGNKVRRASAGYTNVFQYMEPI